jgi:hypothetical protein
VEPLEDRRVLSLLGLSLGYPQITFDQVGVTSYNAGTDLFHTDATPLRFRMSPTSTPRNITGGTKNFEIEIYVNQSGAFTGGVAGHDLIVTGSLDIDGNGSIDYSGTLLTGEGAQFGFLDNPGSTDTFDFRFHVSGGALASFYAGMDLGVFLNVPNSTFSNNFGVNFGGGGSGTLGAIAPSYEEPVPEPQSLIVFSLVATGSVAAGVLRRKRTVSTLEVVQDR